MGGKAIHVYREVEGALQEDPGLISDAGVHRVGERTAEGESEHEDKNRS